MCKGATGDRETGWMFPLYLCALPLLCLLLSVCLWAWKWLNLKGENHSSFFLGCIHFPHALSLSLASALSPPVLLSACDSQFIQTRQVAQSLWGWSLGSSQTGRSQPPALSARGASTPSRGTPSSPDWTSTERQTPGPRRIATAPSGSRWVELWL